jgi:hypothetical protein
MGRESDGMRAGEHPLARDVRVLLDAYRLMLGSFDYDARALQAALDVFGADERIVRFAAREYREAHAAGDREVPPYARPDRSDRSS